MCSNKKLITLAATLLLLVACVSAEASVDPAPDQDQEQEQLEQQLQQEEQDCPLICPALYAPICGTDGASYQQFDNNCLMQVGNCQLKRALIKPYAQTDMYWCTSELVENLHEKLSNLDLQRPECLKPCPMIYAPICVSNGKYRGIAVNECQMEIYNCVLRSIDAAADLFKVLRPVEC